MKIRWDRIQVGDTVDMISQGPLRVISRQFDERSGLWVLGFLHPVRRCIWRVGYIGWHEEEVRPRVGSEREAIEQELVLWVNYALDLGDLLCHQNGSLYRAARERDQLLWQAWCLEELKNGSIHSS